ncbi:mtDNA inheritance protein [Grosmannia clavigera kw1407]|uniref:MtDNA inheritance protein n=1 Tax=Grosmannia clavigera (strain kw1407 / UAMH 11150) TaxID=655863 RepID=F0XAM2_GROCL|nr:mtDNA inheritance protein [Grosmannia clavigera kw1407]EFX05416.1 mtDNA inheritance protein [Grosmannia clavigera kw1407]
MHEIITLQLGRQSNYVATHFWNAQESYFTYGKDEPSPVDHDIHWRAGIGADKTETYLPRTVVYDRKGGFGSLRKINALYEAAQEGNDGGTSSTSGTWAGQAVVQRETPIIPSAYTQSLDTGGDAAALTPSMVRYWSDFGRVYYHPRSLVEVGDEPEAADAEPDLSWAAGDALFATLDREHDLLDRDLRPFLEEADQMQGLQVLTSIDDAWGGFAARYLERLRDEYGKSTVWLWALQEPVARMPRAKRLVRLANKARTLASAAGQASLVVPIAMPSLPLRGVESTLDPRLTWHVSALLATAIETATLPSRLRRGGDSLAYMTELLNATGHQTVAHLQMTVGQSWRAIRKAAAAAHAQDVDIDGPAAALRLNIDLAPQDEPRTGVYGRPAGRPKKTRMFGQAVVSRGSSDDKNEKDDDDDDNNNSNNDDRTPDREDMARRRLALQPVSQRYPVDLGFPLLDSFPHIYQLTAAQQTSIRVTTGLATNSTVADSIQGLRSVVVAPWAVSLEDREDLGNELAGMADAYHEGWSSGSDEADDDD